MEESVIRTYSPITFAFIGDAVYSLFIRDKVVRKANCQAKKLHQRTAKYVSAKAQSGAAARLLEEGFLTEEEEDIYRRGKNANTATMAKNATPSEYHKATGFEALLGWLYLMERQERLREIMERAYEISDPPA